MDRSDCMCQRHRLTQKASTAGMCVAAFPGHCNSLAGALLVAQACNRRTQLPENAALSPLTAAGTALRSAPNSKGVLDLEQNNPKLYYKPQNQARKTKALNQTAPNHNPSTHNLPLQWDLRFMVCDLGFRAGCLGFRV